MTWRYHGAVEMTRCHDNPAAERHDWAAVLPDFAAFPIMDGVVGQRLDAGALLDRATAFIRSWGASDVPFTIGHVLALWRLAERDLDEARPGSDAWLAASERFLAARSEYRRLFELAAADADALRQLW